MPSIHEAIDALKVVQRFLEDFRGLVGAPGQQTLPGLVPRIVTISDPPPTWIRRVLKIMADSGQRMRPKDITEEYRRRGWPLPKKGKLGNAIRSTLLYARKRGDAVEENGVYTLTKKGGGVV